MNDSAKSLIIIDPSSGIPVYRQLMDQIKFLITSDVLKPGDTLPSTRSLSSELGVNPMTISKAYSFLEKERVVERRPGLPLVICSIDRPRLKRQKIRQLQRSLRHSVNVVEQLGIDQKEAVRLFQELLDERRKEEEE